MINVNEYWYRGIELEVQFTVIFFLPMTSETRPVPDGLSDAQSLKPVVHNGGGAVATPIDFLYQRSYAAVFGTYV